MGGIINYYFNIFIHMKEETPKDITPIKRRGIEIVVKRLHRKFPFILGYKDDESVDQYKSAHYIDLLIDLDGLANYMGVEVNPYWSNEISKDPKYQKVYAIWSYLKFPNEVDKDIKNHPGYILGSKITSLIESLYEYLPEKYKLYYESDTTFIDPPQIYPVRLKVNGFIMK
jgi:hypothetical protein